MKEKSFPLINKGMNRDLSMSKVGESSAYDNHNIRITARDHDTLLSITNERGNKELSLVGTIHGDLIGWNVLNDHLVIFTTGEAFPQSEEQDGRQWHDHIYRIDREDQGYTLTALYHGELGFDIQHPIESVVYFETEDLQKIYWVDGVNVLRFMNFMATPAEIQKWADAVTAGDYTVFDSNRVSEFDVDVTITKDNAGNVRPNGVVQYLITYFTNHGSETGYVWMSDLVYLSPSDRGGEADGTNTNNVMLTIKNLDIRFTHFRVYSVMRTEYNGTTQAYLVGEYEISTKVVNHQTVSDTIMVTDDGGHLTAEDSSKLLYLGSQPVIAGTLEHKDDTLFLGELHSVGNDYKADITAITKTMRNEQGMTSAVMWDYSETPGGNANQDILDIPYTEDVGTYPYNNQLVLSSSKILSFKGGEKYRFALKFQREDGTDTEAFWAGDSINNQYPVIDDAHNTIKRPIALCILPVELIAKMKQYKLKTVQLMIAEASDADRSVKAQGIINPTMFNVWERYNDGLYSIPSWITRPRRAGFAWKHFSPVHNSIGTTGEISCNYWESDEVPTPYVRYKNYKNTSADPIQIAGVLEGKSKRDFVMIVCSTYVTGSTSWFGSKQATVDMWIYFITMFSTATADINEAKTLALTPPTVYSGETVLVSNKKYEIVGIEGPRYQGPCAMEDCEKAYAKFADEANKKYNVPLYAIPTAATLYAWIQYSDTAVQPWVYNNPKFAGQVGLGASNVPTANALNYTDGGSTPSDDRWYSMDTNAASLDSYYQPAYYKKHLMFVDENVVTLNSPELEYGTVSVDNAGYKLRIVGAAKMCSVITDYTVEATKGHLQDNNLDKIQFSGHVPNIIDGLISWPLWLENGLEDNRDEQENDIHKRTSKNYLWGSEICRYWLHMWNRAGKINGFIDEDGNDYSTLKKKTFANLRFGYNTTYVSSTVFGKEYSLDSMRMFNQVSSQYTQLHIGNDRRFYDGVISTSLLVPGTLKYPVPFIKYMPESIAPINLSDVQLYTQDPVQIDYASSPHAVLALHSEYSGGKYKQRLLPYLSLGDKYTAPVKDEGGEEITGGILPWTKNESLPNYIWVAFEPVDPDSHEVDSWFPETFTVTKAYSEADKTISLSGTVSASYRRFIELFPDSLSKLPNPYMCLLASDGYYYLVSVVGIRYENDCLVLTDAHVEERCQDSDQSVFAYVNTYRAIDDALAGGYDFDLWGTKKLYLSIRGMGSAPDNDFYPYIDYDVLQEQFDLNSHKHSAASGINADDEYVLIGEIYNDFSGEDTRYGGISESAVAANRFIKAGPQYSVKDLEDQATLDPEDPEIIIYANQGDTYFQRWDCVKTKPYSDDSVNNVIDITSVMLESHINLDGRCDLQRGLNKLASLNLDEFGKMNPVYSQKNNFLISRDLPADFDLNSYRSSITWTLPKTDMATIDEWTHITLASTLKLDGNKGFCRALRRLQNSLIAFQDKGIAEILFNSRTQLSTTDGVPVEIANSGKVDGKYYLTNKYGCLNKWSIVEGKQGLYFVDDHNKAFCGAGFTKYGKLQVENISSKLGFDTWFRNKSSLYTWYPVSGRNIISFYDKVHSDVYLVNADDGHPDDCLVYNETLGVFTSFFDYGGVQMMANIGLDFISYKDKKFWLQNQGFYGRFFGDQYDYWTTYRVTPEPYEDKIWTNVEYQADMFNALTINGDSNMTEEPANDSKYLPNDTFDSLRVWNEYQDTSNSNPSPVKKFRRWRYIIPRANKTATNKWGLDRIRNPWIMLRLAKHTDTNDRRMMQIHDVIVKYFE